MSSFRVSPGRIGPAARPQPLAKACSKPRRAVVTAVSSFSASETSTELKVLRRQLEYAVQQVGEGVCNAHQEQMPRSPRTAALNTARLASPANSHAPLGGKLHYLGTELSHASCVAAMLAGGLRAGREPARPYYGAGRARPSHHSAEGH